MDVLSNALNVVRLAGAVFFTATFSSRWAIASPDREDIALYWLLRTSDQKRSPLTCHRQPHSRRQEGLTHRKSRGNGSLVPEKTAGYGQQTIREGMNRLQERLVTDLFSHELAAGWTLSTSWTLAQVILFQAAQW